jgi:serine/threonine protein kinase
VVDGNSTPELDNLAILNCLKHPNIVELLGSYIHDSKQNLIFPRASRGDLSNLLEGDRQPQFASNESFLVALGALSFAVETVHNLADANLQLTRSGCHHDIKPKNILVDGAHFILADFGLSKFKDPEQTSETTFRVGEGYYMAPEGQDVDGEFEKHAIRRSSDIWSFGCIIAELLTYMMKGPAGVMEFKDRRKFKLKNWVLFHFHAGNEPNDGVTKWLSHLEYEASQSSSGIDPRTCLLLLQLVKTMLAMRPDDRPNALQVETTLCFIAIDALARKIGKLYSHAITSIHSNSMEALIEAKRFEGWQMALGMSDTDRDGSPPGQLRTHFSVNSFQQTAQWLSNIEYTLNDILSSARPTQFPIFPQLRCLNQNLLSQLPLELREQAESYLQFQLLGSEEATYLEDIHTTLQEISADRRLLVLAAIRRMTILTQDRSTTKQPQLDPKPLIDNEAGDKSTGYMVRDGIKDGRVLVEWKHYGEHWDTRAKELLERMEGLAQLLGSVTISEDLRILHCSGFYNAPDRYALGLVFDFPTSGSEQEFTTLQKIYDKDLDTSRAENEHHPKPLLGSRFELARRLAVSVLEFHKLGWLHKSLSSSNIVFFNSSDSSMDKFIEKPYVVGFEHSRPNEEDAYTSRLPPAHRDYQHPEFLQGTRFRPEFDYYSFGLVLLELGLWKSIKAMTKSSSWESIQPESFRQKLLRRRVPQLGQSMGARYRDAVKACLQWESKSSLEREKHMAASGSVALDFQRLVVEQLASCKA